MTRYTRLVIGVAIGAATLLASALAFAQGNKYPDGPPVSRRIEPTYRPAPPTPTYRPAPPVSRPAPSVYRPAPPVYRPQPPVYRPAPPVYRPQPPVYRPPVYRPQPPIYRPAPVYPPYVYQPAPVYPVAPPTVWQDYPGEPAYGCVWRKRKVWTVHGLRTKWRRVCY